MVDNAPFSDSTRVVGRYLHKAGATVPDGWLLCDGRAISRTTYAALDSEVYVGDASNATAAFFYRCTNQNSPSTSRNTAGAYLVLPDGRGRVLGGAGQGANLTDRAVGTSVGAETHTLTTTEMPAHTHRSGYVRQNYDANDVFSNYNGIDNGSGDSNYYTSSTGGGGAHNNMQPTLFAGYLFIQF